MNPFRCILPTLMLFAVECACEDRPVDPAVSEKAPPAADVSAKSAAPRARGALPVKPAVSVSDLPLVERPAQNNGSHTLAIMATGDGGWRDIDKQISRSLTQAGVSIVGLVSPKYLWYQKTPQTLAADFGRLVDYYTAKWNIRNVWLIGYSRGAEMVPFMAAGAPAKLQQRIRLVAMIGPAHGTAFLFHVIDLTRDLPPDTLVPVMPAVQRIKHLPLLCVFGTQEKDSLCHDLTNDKVRLLELNGGHHFGGQYDLISRAILESQK